MLAFNRSDGNGKQCVLIWSSGISLQNDFCDKENESAIFSQKLFNQNAVYKQALLLFGHHACHNIKQSINTTECSTVMERMLELTGGDNNHKL